MYICHKAAIHISSVEVHDHTEDMCILYHLLYQMLWHKYDAHVLIFLTIKKTKKHEETTPSIRFHIYHIIGRCNTHGRIPFNEKKYVTCVNKNLHQTNLQKYTPEKN